MGYYCAWGDTKIMCSSEEEGYENCAFGNREKRNRVSGTSGETFAPVLAIPDDTDRQFWAEDELSNSEASRQKLITRRKRRHSMSYRNRTANKNCSQDPRTSSSSSNSIYAESSPKTRRIRRYCRCRLKPETEKLQSLKIGKASCTSIEEMPCRMNEVFPECQVASTSGQSINSHREIYQTISSRADRQQRASDTIRMRKAELRRGRDATRQK